jgi:hypothetical protein
VAGPSVCLGGAGICHLAAAAPGSERPLDTIEIADPLAICELSQPVKMLRAAPSRLCSSRTRKPTRRDRSWRSSRTTGSRAREDTGYSRRRRRLRLAW